MDTARALQIRRVPLAELQPDPANARTHGPANLQAITDSLRRFGQAEPLIVQAGTMRLIAGHGRLDAMKRLGWSEAAIVELEVESIEAAALGIALNRSASLGAWDDVALAHLLSTLQAEDALDGVGYSAEEVATVLAAARAVEQGAKVVDPGPVEPVGEPVTRLGDLWLLDQHGLLCGSSLEAANVTRVMAGERAVLLASDPPYCVEYTGANRPVHDGKKSGKDWSAVYREVEIKDLGEFLDAAFRACLPHTTDDAPIYTWHAHVQQPVIAQVFERHGILFHQCLIWVKPCAVFGHSYYQWQHEPCAFGWKQGHKPTHGTGQLSSVWNADWDGKARFSTFHPTSKPTRLFEIPMEQHTKPGDIVLEPFSGSGSQIIAAEKLGRRCCAIELSPTFVDGTIDRWQRATGKHATLDGDGRTFDEIRAERAPVAVET